MSELNQTEVEAPTEPGQKTADGSQSAQTSRAWLENHRLALQRQRDQRAATESRWSWTRLATFIAAVSIWYPLSSSWPLASLASALAAVLFILSVLRHLKSKAARELADRVLLMADESLSRCGGQVVLVRSHERPADLEDGAEAIPPILDGGCTWRMTPQECSDLDFYGAPVGLFGLLNRTSTPFGALRLRDALENPSISGDHIRSRQAAVRRLEEAPAERLRLMAGLATLRGETRRAHAFLRAVRKTRPLASPIPPLVLRIWSVPSALFAATCIVLIMTGNFVWMLALAGLSLVNFALFSRINGALRECIGLWRNVSPADRGYLTAAAQAVRDLPDEGELGTLREKMAAVVAPDVLPSLCRRIGWADSGGALHVAANIIAFFDLHVVCAILKRAEPNRAALLAGIAALADLELLTSLACFAWEQPDTCYPTPVGGAALSIHGGRHPLISPLRVVANDVDLGDEQRVWIVTGSNMSGKSTFIRMIGVNVLLAQLGTGVCAREMSWSPLRVITDLQAHDSLADDESYFLAEVRQLRRMVLPPEHTVPVLGLIDEPLRGTNSQEQDAAGIAVVKHLLRTQHLFLVATHDRNLTTLADGRTGVNRHFREDLGSQGLVFDYKLRDGPARTRNALRILEREGYPDELVKDAHDWLASHADTWPDPEPPAAKG